ncbi:hypothetical protein HMPREF0762_00466 [Slackia exigua ATCC 700122]|uniref:Lipoprotein n=1 Tax=Slackia exigua (strain ATCC 700122 / DSM 15923 / CIP 105133 / JCM 11022 / KCTC 5966 / S-7) TaxID=649764 RepID=D0WFE8_SLAES|nr:hypothetical protein HMPREF0762_00466 [Slackia exigua ATCC 700122]
MSSRGVALLLFSLLVLACCPSHVRTRDVDAERTRGLSFR